jgi:acyl-CoA thioesterase
MNNDEIKEFFKKDRFAGLIGVKLESIKPDEIICSIEIEEHHLNAGDKVQGGVIFTLADFTFAVACNYDGLAQNQKTITVGHSNNISFFKPPTGKKLIAKSKCLQKGRKLSVYRMTVHDDNGVNVAEMTGNAYTVSLERR